MTDDALVDQRAAFDATVELARKHRMWDKRPAELSLGWLHLLEMQAEIHAGSFSPEKLGRWLGWAQAALVVANVGVTLDDLKALNKRFADATPEPDVREKACLPDRPPVPPFPLTEDSWVGMWNSLYDWYESLVIAMREGEPEVDDA